MGRIAGADRIVVLLDQRHRLCGQLAQLIELAADHAAAPPRERSSAPAKRSCFCTALTLVSDELADQSVIASLDGTPRP